jgi:Flp pilus assembly protein TadG
MVEFALVVPLLLVLIMGMVDFGMALRAYVTVTNASREGARLGVTCRTDGPITDRTVLYSSNLLTASDVIVVANPCSSGAYVGATDGLPVTVTATRNHHLITPLGNLVSLVSGGTVPNTIPLSATTTMRVE